MAGVVGREKPAPVAPLSATEAASVDDVEHLPERPSWACGACGRDWPCDPAREWLRATMGPTPLAIYLWAQFEQAALELPHLGMREGAERFLTWMRQSYGS